MITKSKAEFWRQILSQRPALKRQYKKWCNKKDVDSDDMEDVGIYLKERGKPKRKREV